MKNFTLFFVLTALAMNVAGQSNPLFNRLETKHHEALVKLVGEGRAKTLEKVLSHPFPLQRETTSKSANEYVLKLDSTVSTAFPNSWEIDYKDEFIYDASWRAVELIENSREDSQYAWQLVGTTKLMYDNQGQLSKILMYSAENSILVDSTLMESYFGTSGRLDSLLTYEVMNGEWVLVMKQYYTYNEAGLLAKMAMLSEEDTEEIWMEFMSYRYIYNEAGKRHNVSVYFSDEEGDFLYSETLYFYDTIGRLSHRETSSLSFFTFEFEKVYKVAFIHGAGEDISEQVYYQWGDDWFETSRTEFIYDGFINYADVVFPFTVYEQVYNPEGTDFSFNKLPIETREYEAGEMTNKTQFYYSSTSSTSAKTPAQETAGLFPNPATGHISFTWPDGNKQLMLEMYQVNGAKVLQQAVGVGGSLSVSHLDRGLYFYRLTGNGQVHASGKILLQ